ncbi:MAG: Phosphonopyruvate hydrolase [Chlamydiales bacterium]|nr:Phosphonopyruvate hydrolase [Chlamydiales bacterium]MCH9636069.1 Phosphonopyruvate hydrolase [Chlamydiales bacterium]MCH9703220.1 phosphoenolpyruvate mutase [Chlamydiota bacterium]
MREILESDELCYAMEVHNGISAKIAERAGFKLLWASGLTLSASCGHRDCNELSWSQVCDQLEYMAAATDLPILMDGDTGYGNFNQVRLLAKKLERYGIAGLCMEDKIFPKTNSFLPYGQKLAPIEEFAGKIKAAKDVSSLVVVARTEAFIAGLGLEEAVNRAYAYEAAGADAILVHSKRKTAVEIEAFCSRWEGSCPLIVVPTTYMDTPRVHFEQMGISVVIWANQLLRASIRAMEKTCQALLDGGVLDIASVDEIFSLVDEKELVEAEKLYCCPRL